MTQLFKKFLLYGALVALTGCVSPLSKSRSQGLEELVTCRFGGEAAEEMNASYDSKNSVVRSKSYEKVAPELAEQFVTEHEGMFGDHYVRSFWRPINTLTIYEAKVRGILFFFMHGSFIFAAIAEGDFNEVKFEIDAKSGLIFAASDNVEGSVYYARGKSYENFHLLGSHNVKLLGRHCQSKST